MESASSEKSEQQSSSHSAIRRSNSKSIQNMNSFLPINENIDNNHNCNEELEDVDSIRGNNSNNDTAKNCKNMKIDKFSTAGVIDGNIVSSGQFEGINRKSMSPEYTSINPLAKAGKFFNFNNFK